MPQCALIGCVFVGAVAVTHMHVFCFFFGKGVSILLNLAFRGLQ